MQFTVALETDALNVVESGTLPQSFGYLEHAVFALPTHNDVHVLRLQRLARQQGGMPPAQYHREIPFPALNGATNIHRLADHRTRDQRDAETQRVLDFLKNAALVIRRNGGVDDADFIARLKKGSGDG